MKEIAELFVNVVGIYLLLGLLFAVVFVLRGAEKIDANVKGTSVGFRLLLIPGSILLWPLLLRKWLKTRT